jgi:hypothetical protein
MREKLTGRAKEALDDLEVDPSDDNQADLRKQLTKQLEIHPELVSELRALIPADGQGGGGQTLNQIGDRNRAAQAEGVGNKVRVS